MKRNFTLLFILMILFSCNSFAQSSKFRGAYNKITSLATNYCNSVGDQTINHNALDSKTINIKWGVTYDSFLNDDQPTWYTVIGSGVNKTIQLHISAIPDSLYGRPIVVSYYETDGKVIINTVSDVTYVYKEPDIFTFSKDTTICPGGTATLNLSDSESNMKYILYQDGVRTSNSKIGTGNKISFNVSSAGTYTLKAYNVGDSTCIKDMTGSATVSKFPLVNPILTGSSSICIGSSTTYTTDAGQSAYTWSISSGGSIIAGNGTKSILVFWHTSGAQTVTVNYTNANGCSSLTPPVTNVDVHPLPTPTINGNTKPCISSTAVYSTEAGMSGYTWTVSGGGTISAGTGTNTITVNWNNIGAQTISVNYTDSYGCSPATATVKNISVKARPNPTITGLTSVCQGTSGVVYQTETGQSSYNWSITGGTITAGGGTNQVTVTWNTAGAQKISVNYANSDGCTALAATDLSVTIKPQPIPTITGKDTICLGQLNTVYSTESGKNAYNWNVDAGGTIVSGATTNQVTINWTTAGNPRTLNVTYQDTNGCNAATPTTKSVIVSDLPVPSITGLDSVCAGTTNLSYSTETSQNSYSWSISSGGVITSSSTSDKAIVDWTTAGNNTLSITYKNSYGCPAASPFVKNIFVKNSPTPTIAGPNAFCLDPSSTKTYTTQAGMSNYTWTVSSGGTITAGANSNSISVQWTTTGTKTVTVNYNLPNGCAAPSPTQYTVTITSTPNPTITGLSTVCDGNTYTYSTESGMSNYNWTVSPGDIIVNGTGTNTIDVKWNSVGSHTISINYDNAGGCSALTATSVNVSVLASPSPSITSGPTTACEGETSTYTTETSKANYVWTVPTGGTITSGQSTNSVNVTWSTAGNHTVTVNYENTNGCLSGTPATINVTVNPTTIPTITGLNNVCKNSMQTYDTEIGMSNYIWTVVGGTILTGQGSSSINVQWTTTGTQSVSVIYTNAHNCTAQTPTKQNVTVNTLPVPTITGSNSVCNNHSITYTTEPGMSNYNWNISGGGIISSGSGTNQITIDWNTVGKHAVKVSYTSPQGCLPTIETIDSVTVKASPTPTITGSTIVCAGSKNVIYSTEAGQSNYDWQISAGGTITSGLNTKEISVTWNTDGAQTVSINYQNANGCPAGTATVQSVTVNPVPTPIITGSNSVCKNSTQTYTTESGMSNYIWNISGGTILSGQGTNVVDVKWNTLGSQTISVNYNNISNCSALTPTQLNITVNSLPNPTITGTKSICNNHSATYSTETGMSSYNWSISGGGIISAGAGTNQITVDWTTVGTHAVKVSYTSPEGCLPATETIDSITINASPTPTIDGFIAVCEGSTNVVYSTTSGQANYDWQISAGGTITSGLNTNQITVTWNTPGAQVVSVNYQNANGCSASTPTIKNVTVVGKPVPTITGPILSCNADTVTYSTDASMNSYVWTVSGGTILSGQSTNTISVLWNSVGTQTITVTYKNSLGCGPDALTSKTITVGNPANPTISGSKALCAGVTTTYTTEAGMSNYVWNVSSGGTLVSGGSTNQITVTWNTAGTRTVSVNYDNLEGCNATKAKVDTITVYDAPAPVISGLSTVCEGATSVNYTTTGGMSNYVWTVTGGTIVSGSGTNSILINWSSTGNQTITLNYENAGHCSAAVPSSKTVNIVAKPIPTISGALTPCQNEIVTYTTESAMNNYNWVVSSGGTIISGQNTNTLKVQWNNGGAQTVAVSYNNATGCSAASPTSIAINVNSATTPTITGTQTVCEKTTGVVYSTESGMSNYTWSIIGGTITAGLGTNQVTVNWNTAGKQAIKVNYKNTFGCTATSPTVDSITVNPITYPSINGNMVACEGSNGIVYTTEIGLNNYNWTISSGGTIVSGQGTYQIVVNWPSQGNQTLGVNFINQYGCQAANKTDSTIKIISKPVPTITGYTSACADNKSTYTYTTEAGMSNYTWNISSGGNIIIGGNTRTILVEWKTPGSQTVSVNYTVAGGCTADNATVLNITVHAPITPTLTGPDTVCANGQGYLFTANAGQKSYSWASSTSQPNEATFTQGAQPNEGYISWLYPGVKYVTVTCSDANGCQTVGTSVKVYAKASPSPTITGIHTLCEQSSNIKYYTEGGQNNYSWNISSGGTILSGQNTDTILVKWNTAGLQTLTVNYENSIGCVGTKKDTIIVNSLPVPKITASNNGCLGTNTTITTDAGMSNYVWTISAGGTIVSGQGTNQIVVSWSSAGSETVGITYTNANGCNPASPTTKTFTVSAPPVVVLTASEDTICAGTAVNFDATSGLSNYTYNINGSNINNGSSSSYTSSSLTDGTQIYVIGTSTNGCVANSNTIKMKVFAIPTAGLSVSPSSSIIYGTNTTFTASGTGDYQFYLNGTIVQAYSTTNSYALSTLKNNDVVSVKVRNGNNCYDSTAITITALDTITPKPIITSANNYCVSDNGVSIVLNNPQTGVTYQLIRTNDNTNLGTGTVSGSSIIWNNVKTGINGTRDFKVIGYYPAFPSNKVDMTNTVSVTQRPVPSTYFVTPTGTVSNCNGGSGYEIKLSNSDLGIEYFLYKDGAATGKSLLGTGSGLSFGSYTTSGTYTVVAKDTLVNTCTTNMSGTFVINIVTTSVFNLSGTPANGHYCAGASGVTLNLDGSVNGVDYLLYRDGTNLVKTVTGTGSAISFGSMTVEGVYTVSINQSGCLASMNGSVNVVKEALPVAYNLSATNNGFYCEGTNGVTISLDNQEVGVQYQLLYNGNPVGTPVTGNIAGAAFDFAGTYLNEGVYSVLATKTIAGCTSTSANTISVDKTNTPLDLAITGDATFCNGGTANINISGTESDVTYKLLKDNVETGVSNIGNGGILTFTVNAEGTYKISAQRNSGGTTCPILLTSSLAITKIIDPDIKAYTSVPGTSCTQGTVITIIQTQVGVKYTLYNKATNVALTGYTLTGDGSDLSFAPVVDSNGDYYIVANNGGCDIQYAGYVHVAIAGAVQKQELTVPSAICSNTTTTTIGLKNTENGVSYKLYLANGSITNTDTLINTITGTGSSMSFAPVSKEGTYFAVGSSAGCDVAMLNQVTVKFNTLPNIYNLSGGGYFCPSMNGTTITLDGTQTGFTYALQLKSGASWNLVNQIVASGQAISFNNITTNGDYNVLATSTNGCTSIMNDTINVEQKTTPNAYTVSVDNANYCSGSVGADINISGTQKDVNYFIINISTNDTVTYLATADNSTTVKIATVPEGFYNVWAVWQGSTCDINLTPTPLQVSKSKLNINNFTISIDDALVCNGDSTFVRVPNAENAMYDLEIDGVMQNTPVDASAGEVKWKVSGLANSTTSFKVFAYENGHKPCGFYSDNNVSLQTKAKPTAYSLTPSIASICKGDTLTKSYINVSGADASLIYELYNSSNTLVDSYTAIGSGNFSFAKAVSPNDYYAIAKYSIGSCSALMNDTATVTLDDSSYVCFPFEAVKDVIYLPVGSSTASIHVSNIADGGNDILSSIVDLNLEYKLITSWTDTNGNPAKTNGNVSFVDKSKDVFTYTKNGNFFGKDSVIYEITNLDHPNRKDTAIIYIFVGNQEIKPTVTILIPNAFSPNGDGKNDYFVLEGVKGLISSELQVFNRWGALVYKSTGDTYDNTFDGTANNGVSFGKELPVGTYFYIYKVTFEDNGNIVNKKFSGYIELRR